MANTLRTGWESVYYLSYQTSSISTGDNATDGLYHVDSTLKGVLGVAGDHGLLLDSNSWIDGNQEYVKTPKTTGLAEDKVGTGYEFVGGRRSPTASLEMALNKYTMATFGWLLFQQGVTEGGAALYTKTMIPPVVGNSSCEVWANIGHRIGDGSEAEGYSLTGCIATQLAISGAEGERMKLVAEMVGRYYVNDYDHALSDSTYPSEADHMFWNYTFTLAGYSLSAISFDMNIVNNVSVKHYSLLIPSTYIMQKFATTGNMKIAMTDDTIGDNVQVDNFLAGTDALLVVTYASNNVMSVNAKYSGVEMDAADENMLSLPFEAVHDGTNNSVKIQASDSVSRGVPV